MAFEWDPVIFCNLILCIIIVVLGILCSYKSGEKLPVFIAAAFGLFGISHAATLAGLKSLTILLIAIRTLAYLLVIFALYLHLKDSVTAKETRQAWVDFFKADTDTKDRSK